MPVLLLLLLGVGPEPWVIHDSREIVEINIVYDGDGKEVFQQYLFWSENERAGFDIDHWHIIKSEPVIHRGALLFWEGDKLRKVQAGEVRTRHLQYDIELEQRSVLPTTGRRGITRRR